MSVRDKPHYTLPAATLASWIESQPDQWWSVDGDPPFDWHRGLPLSWG